MDIKSILEKIGLNKKETDIYLTYLKHGPESITNIARLSGYKRSTLYNLVESLLKKGFLVLIRRNKRTYYDATKPRKLLAILHAKERELEKLMPELEKVKTSKRIIPQIKVYETEENIRDLYYEIYSSFNTKEEVCFLTSVSDLEKYAPFALKSFRVALEKNKKYKIRELIFADKAGRSYVRNSKKRKVKHNIKLLPANFPIYNDIVVFKDKVVLFSFKKRIIATFIDYQEIAQTVKSLYEWAWKNAKSS